MPDSSRTDLSKLQIQRDTTAPDDPGPRSRWAFILYTIGGVVIVLAVAFIIRSLLEKPEAVETAIVSYVSPTASQSLLTASGYVVAQRKAAIASKATGRIVGLYFLEGDKVRKGDIIAKIESDDVSAALEGARADLAVAEADLFEAEKNYQRSTRLISDTLISQADHDLAKSRYDGAQAAVESRRAALRAAEVAVENTNIRAPFDGTILTKNADIGEVVAPFAAGASSRVAVVTLADMGSLQVEADVSESNITNVSIRQNVEITLDAYPERRYRGVVDKIVPTADRTKATVMTKVRFLERDERVLPEMGAKVHFLREAPVDTSTASVARLSVDERAVIMVGDRENVFVLDGNVVSLRPIRTGERFGTMIEVREGLASGEKVVINPPEKLYSGAEVVLKP